MQEGTRTVKVKGIEFTPSKDRVFFDFDGVLHTSTQAVKAGNGFIENRAEHYAEYWKLKPNEPVIDFIHELCVVHDVPCYLLTANDYRTAQLFIRENAPRLKGAFRNMFSRVGGKGDFLDVMGATHFFDDSDSVMHDVMKTNWSRAMSPALFYVRGGDFCALEASLEESSWEARQKQAAKLGVASAPLPEAHVVDAVLASEAATISHVIGEHEEFTGLAPMDEQNPWQPDSVKIAKNLMSKGAFIGAYGFFFGTAYCGERHRQLTWPAIYKGTKTVAKLTAQHLFLTVPSDRSNRNFITYTGNPYAVSAAHYEAIKANPSQSLTDNDRYPMVDIERAVLRWR